MEHSTMSDPVEIIQRRLERQWQEMALGRKMIAYASVAGRVRPDSITSASKEDHLVRLRWAITFVLKTFYGDDWSYPKIGRLLNRDFSTLIHGHNRATVLYLEDEAFRALCDGMAEAVKDRKAA